MNDEAAELMGPSDSESANPTPWDPTSNLTVAESTGSCKLMDPFFTIGRLETGTGHKDEAAFPDSDDSEINRRRRRHRIMPDPLKKLLKKEIPHLLDYLQWDLPLTAHVRKQSPYGANSGILKSRGIEKDDFTVATVRLGNILAFIKMILKWKDLVEMKREGLKYRILVSREECAAEYPLVIASYVWKEEVRGSIYAPSYTGVQALKEAIKYSKIWPGDSKDGTCEWAVYPAEAAIEFLSVKRDRGRHYTAYPVHLYWMSPADLQATQFEMPREFKTEPLEEKHASTIDHYWGRHRTGSMNLIQQMIVNNRTVGAFTFNDEFISWALQTHYGALDVFYTVHRHRRKGIARSLLRWLAHVLDEDGSPTHAFAQRDDHYTKAFLTKSGFTFVTEYFYFYMDPPLRVM